MVRLHLDSALSKAPNHKPRGTGPFPRQALSPRPWQADIMVRYPSDAGPRVAQMRHSATSEASEPQSRQRDEGRGSFECKARNGVGGIGLSLQRRFARSRPLRMLKQGAPAVFMPLARMKATPVIPVTRAVPTIRTGRAATTVAF